ncbi:MAG TPA: hypothetical protein VGM43_12800 [Bryobacteraceae bacterium]|jgi:hypothetical protein
MSRAAGTRILGAFSVILLLAFVALDYAAPAGRRLAKVRGEDPVAYFGMAHSILVDHDFNLNNEYEHMPPDGRMWTKNQPGTGLPGSPWGLGYSFLEIPLLAIGTGADAIAGNPADGYSHWAVFFYSIGNVLITCLGLVSMYLWLQSVAAFGGGIDERRQPIWALVATAAIFFGTNVGYYAFSQMSHASTFLFATLFLWTWWRVRESERARDWLALGVVGGFLSICRWQDCLYLTGPLMFDLWGTRVLKLARGSWWRGRLPYAAGVLIWWIPQSWQWKMIYGKYLTIPQGGGIFSFPPQHMLQVLFSSQSGWFIWTPLTLLGVAGLLAGAVKSARTYVPWIIILTLQVAVVGSVWFWSGVQSFGARYLLSDTPLIGLGLITLINSSPARVRWRMVAVWGACCMFTLLFAVQFRFDLVPQASQLTFSELVTDKFRLLAVRKRRLAVQAARASLDSGDAAAAIRLLEGVRGYGEDRDVEFLLEKAWRAAGGTAKADAAALTYRRVVASRLY